MREFRVARDELSPKRSLRRNMLKMWSAVTVLLCVVTLALFVPRSIYHSVNGRIETLVSLPRLFVPLMLMVVIACYYYVMARLGLERAKLKTVYALTDQDLLRRRDGWPDVRIGLSEVKSLTQKRRYLVVESAEPRRVIAIPNEIEGFASLRAELEKHCLLADSSRLSFLEFVPVAAFYFCGVLALLSSDPSIAKLASVIGLALLAYSSFRLLGRGPHSSPKRVLVWIMIGLSWMAALLLVYLRVLGGWPDLRFWFPPR